MSRSAAKSAKVRAERDRLLEAGKPYEALQLYKTAVSRARAKKEWADAQEMAVDGATALLRTGGADGASCGGELAAVLVELYGKSGAPCGPTQVRTLLDLARLFPAPTAADVAADDSSKDALVGFLRSALKWSQTVAPAGVASGSGCPDIHLALARRLRSLGDFPASHQQYLRSGGASAELSGVQPGETAAEHAALLVDWASPNGGGLPSELDLFVARALLQYLCVEDLASAHALLKSFAASHPTVAEQPIMHFAAFISELCERSADAAPLFDLLRHKYAPALSRDPGLDAYLDKIAAVYFGREAPKSFMDSLMGAMESKPQRSPQTSAAAAPAAAAAAAAPMEQADEPMAPDVD